jgi:hypothetical protein
MWLPAALKQKKDKIRFRRRLLYGAAAFYIAALIFIIIINTIGSHGSTNSATQAGETYMLMVSEKFMFTRHGDLTLNHVVVGQSSSLVRSRTITY